VCYITTETKSKREPKLFKILYFWKNELIAKISGIKGLKIGKKKDINHSHRYPKISQDITGIL